MAWPGITHADATTFATSCSATAVSVFGTPFVAANPQQTPCADQDVRTASEYIPVPNPDGALVTFSGPESVTSSGPNGDTDIETNASSSVAEFEAQWDAEGLFVSAGALSSGATASVGPCPAAAQLIASSTVNELSIELVGEGININYSGSQPQTYDLPGVATIFVNQQIAENGAITVRPLDIRLAGSNQDIVAAESSAGAACP